MPQILPPAYAEALEAAVWYETQQIGLGVDFLTELECAYQSIDRSPESFSQLEDFPEAEGVRRCPLKRFPYLVIYLTRHELTLVLAVSHVRRQPLYRLERLG